MKKEIFLCFLIVFLLFLCPIRSIAQESGADNIGIYPATGSFEDVIGGSNYVYLAQDGVNDAALVIIDLTNPKVPSFIGKGSRLASASIKSVDVNTEETIAVLGAGSNVYVFNISDKQNPERTDEIYVGSTVYDLEVRGDLVFCAAHSAGLPVVNISDIHNIEVAYNGDFAGLDADSWLHGISYDESLDRIYAAGGDYFMVFELNESNLPQMAPKKLELTGNTMYSVEKLSSSQVAAANNYGITWIIDISDLNDLKYMGSVDVGSEVHEILYHTEFGSEMLVADYTSGLEVVDFSLETSPSDVREMGYTTGGIRGYSVTTYGTYALLAAGSWGLLIYTLSECLTGSLDDIGIPGFDLFFILSLFGVCTTALALYKKKKVR